MSTISLCVACSVLTFHFNTYLLENKFNFEGETHEQQGSQLFFSLPLKYSTAKAIWLPKLQCGDLDHDLCALVGLTKEWIFVKETSSVQFCYWKILRLSICSETSCSLILPFCFFHLALWFQWRINEIWPAWNPLVWMKHQPMVWRYVIKSDWTFSLAQSFLSDFPGGRGKPRFAYLYTAHSA